MKKPRELGRIVSIPIESVEPNPAQPRKIFSKRELLSLSDSIRQNGLMQPITVRKKGSSYELISGERRLRASKEAGLREIPAMVVSASEERSAVLAIVENMQREDLNFFETAEAIRLLLDRFGFSRTEAAEALSLSTPALSNKLRILNLTSEEKELILSSGLCERHARALLKIDDEALRKKALNEIIKKGLNVASCEDYIDTLLTPKIKKRRLILVKDVRLFINTITKAVDTMKAAGIKAEIKKEANDGKIEFIISIHSGAELKAQ